MFSRNGPFGNTAIPRIVCDMTLGCGIPPRYQLLTCSHSSDALEQLAFSRPQEPTSIQVSQPDRKLRWRRSGVGSGRHHDERQFGRQYRGGTVLELEGGKIVRFISYWERRSPGRQFDVTADQALLDA